MLKTFKADTNGESTGEIYPNATFQISLFPKETAAQFVGNVPTGSDAKGMPLLRSVILAVAMLKST
ncbi:hypothetical protein BGP_6126 [Beggiatoa sp. PS]|nr:hypothetical protein BGP_6126 [Beggiatoa sp. PS]